MKRLRSIRSKLLVLVWLTTFCALVVAGGLLLLFDNSSLRALRGHTGGTGMAVVMAVVIIAMGAAALLCLWLQSSITRPFSEMLAQIESHALALQSSNQQLAQEVKEHAQARRLNEQLNADLEAKVQERTAQLQYANKELESFCFSVSHDLRGPLRAISGFSQALADELPANLPDDAKRYLGKIFAATSRMGQLIEDLLNLSRVSRGELVRHPVDVSRLASEVARDLQVADPAHQAELSIESGMTTEADPKLLRIVLENLLGNAWKFSSKKPQAHIGVSRKSAGGNEVFCVRDNGAGFDMKYADKLFGPFQRLHGVNEFPGTGIGLATVQRIVHRHGGRIWCESSPDNGAAFYFTTRAQSSSGAPLS